jgi:predicted nucleic acid-binding protein
VIVVDSSVWIANLRDLDTSPVRRLRAIDHATEPVLVGDLILLEVLQGARDESHADRIERALRQFPVAPMLDPDLAVRAARNVRALRARGITVRKTIDVIIGTFCIARGYRLLHDDRDFLPMATHLGLQLV